MIKDPELPPPPEDVEITMKAPDWDLGELKRGETTEIKLAESKDQLCFDYNGSQYVIYQKYILEAESENGKTMDGKSYLLKHASSPADTIPYRLLLEEGTGPGTVSLPNAGKTYFNLNKQGRTCFAPTFHTDAAHKQKGGNYSDVLTFTVVAQP